MSNNNYKLLYRVNSPKELKELSVKELALYCDELREYIIEECATNPGHLASSLGVVELTAALHYTYNSPYDKLIWDVGHQSYPHKIITGRRDKFPKKRTKGGISGFPLMSESEHDPFGGGHSSVSISAALGFAKAAEIKGETYKSVAIIGDGAMTGGLAFEGLNNAASSPETDLLVILNDNHMSIDKVTGALSRYLLRITTSRKYNRLKEWSWRMMSLTPWLQRLFQFISNGLKGGLLRNSNLFESFGFRYFGSVDGHDIKRLTRTLKALRNIKGVKLLHVRTTKGCGYAPAEENNRVWHAPGKFNADTGERIDSNSGDRFQDVFGATLLELAHQDKRIIGVTPAMLSGCSMDLMMNEIPERCFDVGIAEGHAVTYSAGAAAAGLIPFCNIYSSFMQRAYDNIIHDIALQNLHVVLCLDRGGLVGEDGATHHGVFDMAYLSTIPNMIVAAPRNELELRNLIYTAYLQRTPFAIRYPRGKGEGVQWREKEFTILPIGKGEELRKGSEVAILTIGATAQAATQAIQEIDKDGGQIAHYDLRYAKPLDTELLNDVAKRFSKIITVEDGALRGGVGEAVAAHLIKEGFQSEIITLGIEDKFIEHATLSELHHDCKIDKDAIIEAVNKLLK